MNDARLPSRLTRCHAWPLCAVALSLSLMAPTHSGAHEGSTQTFNEGWRQAKVVSLIDSTEPAASTHIHRDCRNQANDAASSSAGVRHVLASYSFGGTPHLRRQIVVPVSPDNTLKVGDTVHAHVSDCQAKAH
jgi:hypothetical protein